MRKRRAGRRYSQAFYYCCSYAVFSFLKISDLISLRDPGISGPRYPSGKGRSFPVLAEILWRGNIFQAFSAVYNGTEGLRNAGFVRSDDTHVPAHNFHTLQSAGKRSFRIRKESFRTDTGPDLLVRHALCGKNRVISRNRVWSLTFP